MSPPSGLVLPSMALGPRPCCSRLDGRALVLPPAPSPTKCPEEAEAGDNGGAPNRGQMAKSPLGFSKLTLSLSHQSVLPLT